MTSIADVGALARMTLRRVPGLLITTEKRIEKVRAELAALEAERTRLQRQLAAAQEVAA